jgi:hypothetical protein
MAGKRRSNAIKLMNSPLSSAPKGLPQPTRPSARLWLWAICIASLLLGGWAVAEVRSIQIKVTLGLQLINPSACNTPINLQYAPSTLPLDPLTFMCRSDKQ